MIHRQRWTLFRTLLLLGAVALASGLLAAAQSSPQLDGSAAPNFSRAPLLNEGFETAVPPTGWNNYNLDGSGQTWARTTGYYHSGTASAVHFYSSAGMQNGWLASPSMAIPVTGASLTFWERINYSSFYYKHSLWVCQDAYVAPVAGATPPGWSEVAAFGTPPEDTWRLQTVSLNAYAGHTIWLAWRYEGNNADDWWIDDVLVQPNLPDLVYQSSALLTDDCLSGGAGDGNGYLEPGEDGTLSVTLQNIGSYQATGVSAVLSTTTPGVTITQDTATFPAIPAGGTGTSQVAYAVSIDDTFPCGDQITFSLTATYARGRATYTGSFPLIVGVPGAPVTLLSEAFDGVTAPAIPTGWTHVDVTGAELNPVTATVTLHPATYSPVSAPNLFRWNCYDSGTTNDQNRLYHNSPIALTGYATPTVSLSMFHDNEFSTLNDYVEVQVSTDGGGTWTTVGSPIFRYSAAGDAWAVHTVPLGENYAGLPSVTVGILCTSKFGNDVYIDNVSVSAFPITCTTCVPAVCVINTCGFTATPDYGAAPLDVALAGTVTTTGCTGTPAYDWDYGDGQTGSGQNVNHTYAAGGTYTVTLTVTVDGETCTDTGTVTVCELACTAGPDVTEGQVPLDVVFDSGVTVTGCTDPVTYAWTVDGAVVSTASGFTHTFTTPGAHTWSLAIASGAETADCGSGTIQVCELLCTALANPAEGVVPLEVTFGTWTQMTGCPGNNLFHWDFGDGSTSDEQVPTHVYTQGGTYTATLTVTVEGTTYECVSTIEIEADPYDLHFLDDGGRSRLCLNSHTGAFQWQVLSGTGKGIYPGTCQISQQGGVTNYTTALGLPYKLMFRYQPATGRADGNFTYQRFGVSSGLFDRNVANNPPGCD